MTFAKYSSFRLGLNVLNDQTAVQDSILCYWARKSYDIFENRRGKKTNDTQHKIAEDETKQQWN